MSGVKYAYRYLPIKGRYGTGQYTYTFIVETQNEVLRYEVFANDFLEALRFINLGFGFQIVNTSVIDSTTWQLWLYGVSANCYLYID